MARGPVGYTCPDIDASIEYVEESLEAAKVIENLSALIGKSGLLETLRKANDALREWGAEQEDRANKLEEDVESLSNALEDAIDRARDLQEEINSMVTT